ncbi:hypothetical protein S7711_05954 [Stachybotrys chartarum IBT 7711]|uniref:CHL4-domain-containing protein n=1 Tax=Stachybotrys chartarum (strain CBS 109288 / IBT 7711) TaxID=1280523 RepID=A0A084AQ47_STACB|nr:hypothetical protein S7711_05954 [Stachybotrys chartarum IBT 7711]
MPRLSVPTAGRLPSTLRVAASNPAVSKILNRLSRKALISLALDWLDEKTVANAFPRLDQGQPDDEDDDAGELYPPCRSLEDARQLYQDMQEHNGSKRDVVSRITEGDWSHGLTMYQLAMADLCYLDEHPSSQKWSAYEIVPLQKPSTDTNDEQILKVDKLSLEIPQFHPAIFLQRLQEHVLPDVKAHYHFHRLKDVPVLLLRIFVVESPYNSALSLASQGTGDQVSSLDSSRTIYLAFPDGSPALYMSKSQRTGAAALGEARSLHGIIVDGVPKALSRPRHRYTLKSSNLASRNLEALLDKKGAGRTNAAGGGWSIYTGEKQLETPLDTTLPTPPLSRESSASDANRKRQFPMRPSERAAKRAKIVAQGRFGNSAIVTDGKGVEKVEYVLRDPFPALDTSEDSENNVLGQAEDDSTGNRRRSHIDATLKQLAEDDGVSDDGHEPSGWAPSVKITLQGPHVFAGIRQLVEAGIVDGERMPGWMTGEESITVGVVRKGRLRAHRRPEA